MTALATIRKIRMHIGIENRIRETARDGGINMALTTFLLRWNMIDLLHNRA